MVDIGDISDRDLAGYLGKKYQYKEGEITLEDNAYLDLNNPHMITICGKRGYGKSYTLAVLLEELMETPQGARNNLAGCVLDPMGIYWSIQEESDEEDLLSDWDLDPKGYDITVYYPAGLSKKYEDYSEYFHEGFAIYPSELTISDWLFMLNIKETQAQAGLLSKVISKIEEKYGEYYGIDDILAEIREQDARDNVKDALDRKLNQADDWGIFSKDGKKIEDVVQGDEFFIIDLSGAGELPWNVRTTLSSILIKKIYSKRSFSRSREEIERVSMTDDQEADFPLVWTFIDEAHLFAPSGSDVPSTEPLVEWVRQGRRPGLSLVLATQQPGALDSRILSQCDTMIIHRLTAGQDSQAVGKKVSEIHDSKSMSSYMKEIPKEPGYALVLNDKTEEINKVKIRPRKSRHAGGSAALEDYL